MKREESDWADEKADELFCYLDREIANRRAVIEALRSARNTALEDAAKAAGRLYINGQIGQDITAAIRAMKTE